VNVILENELEKWAWEIMMAAHYKWEKNHGSSLTNQMEWYFFDLYKEETEGMIQKEVDARLVPDYGPDGFNVIGFTEEQYVREGLDNYKDDDLTKQELEKLKTELVDEYRDILEDYENEKEHVWDNVRLDLYKTYHTFFCAPERLTVIYNGKVIQGGVTEQV